MKSGPLNGTRLHPLTAHALTVLRQLADRGAMPRQEINPGVAARLEGEALIEEVMRPSPYASHKDGRMIRFARITQAGCDKLV